MQPILPALILQDWSTRSKSNHFQHYSAALAASFAALLGFDAWWIDPYQIGISDIDYMTQAGLEPLAQAVVLFWRKSSKVSNNHLKAAFCYC